MILLDTNALSSIMHRLPHALNRLQFHSPREIVICSPVAAEISFGLARLPAGSRKRLMLESEYARLRALFSWCDWTETAAEEFGRQKAHLAILGQLIEDMDLAIGSLAIALDATLATANMKHFRRMSGLQIEDWS